MILVSMIILCCWCCGCYKFFINLFARKSDAKEKNQLASNSLKLENPQIIKPIPTYTIPISHGRSPSEYSYDSPDDSTASISNESYGDNTSQEKTKKFYVRPEQKKEYVERGKFFCSNCNNYWSSVHFSMDCFQKCQICKKNVYPFKLYRSLKKDNFLIPTSPHLKELCEKCQLYGDCRRFNKNLNK